MINKSLLRLVLLFEDDNPVFSDIEKLYNVAYKYQQKNDLYFFKAKKRSRAEILNYDAFFEFVSSELLNGKVVKGFEDIKQIFSAQTREENIKASGDSKNSIVRVFDNVVVAKKSKEIAQLLQKKDLVLLDEIDGFVGIENAESFLNIESNLSNFKYDTFIYLGGYSNSLTREFLKDKKVEFFLDFDIEGMNIFESFECKEKSFFIPKNIEELFREHPNTELYKKQIKNLKQNYDSKLKNLEILIKKHNTVVEQEVCR